MTAPVLLDVGVDCQCGYQLRRLRGTPTAFFWDWLVAKDPEKGVFRVLEEGARRLLEPANVFVNPSRTRVVDARHALEFQHDFPVDGDGLVDAGQVMAALPAVRAKYQFLARRTLEAARAGSVLFVRHERERDGRTASEWRERLQSILPEARVHVALVSEAFPGLRAGEGVFELRLRSAPAGRWQGDDASWTEAIDFCLAHLRAPISAPCAR